MSAVNQDGRLRSVVKDLNIGNYSEAWSDTEGQGNLLIQLDTFGSGNLHVQSCLSLENSFEHHGAVVGYRDRRGGHRRPGFCISVLVS